MAPPKGTQHRVKHTRIRVAPQPSRENAAYRPPLNNEELQYLVEKMKEQFGWSNGPRDFQLDAIKAQLQGKDVIVHAGTGAGKTAIAAGPHLHPSSKGKVTIMVSPLIALHDEQVETFQNEFKLSAVAVNSSHGGCNQDILKKIVAGSWQIVLISPEMLLSKRFVKDVLQNTEFGRKVLSVIIDEAHVVSHWGSAFRKKYGELGKVRYFLPRGTPVVAVSATLPARIRSDVLQKQEFAKEGYVSIDIGNDRANVSLIVRGIQHAMNSYADLDFVVPSNITHASQISKTFIYADNIAVGLEIIDHLMELLPPELRSLGVIRPYNAAHGKAYRKEVMNQFKNGDVRILVCTDAAGMGCNIPDIDLVVQWKLPGSISTFVQRAGRAARAKGRTGIAVLLVEQSAFEVDLLEVNFQSDKEKKGKAKGKGKAYGQTKGSSEGLHDTIFVAEQPRLDPNADNEGLHVLVQTGICRRQVLTEIYKNQSAEPTVPCCDLCAPALLEKVRPGIAPVTQRQTSIKRGETSEMVQTHLHNWRKRVSERDFPFAFHAATALLKDETLVILSSIGPVRSRLQFDKILKEQWVWYSRYADELFELLSGLDIPEFRPLPRKPRGTKQALEQDLVDSEAAASMANPRPARKRMAMAESLAPVDETSTGSEKNRSQLAGRTPIVVVGDAGVASNAESSTSQAHFVVPSMFAPLQPWTFQTIPLQAYNARLWHPYTSAKA
ncbi:P-loop containing nucleoside triphosphate hydrolase protein [Hygrophoropsis aurantiaca]|uniref:P-loop containing nucleoside triphosphate hydrolase protein n=1 Tax=Hygrophoropsis aurantiaca TaxID=72124 RepID=A0ACB8A4I8_9AGAM|nr:P-loop containing nucleoside triphosphate hydrolase protein [Hygrophoropsis aurantiaca]